MKAGKEFIAEDPLHVVVASEQPAIVDTRGRMVQPKRRKVWAKFTRAIAPDYAVQAALAAFSFRKIHEGIAPAQWFGYYNSRDAQMQHGWTEEEHDLIVEKLEEQGYLQVGPVRVVAPWPAYDKLVAHGQRKIEHVVEKIVSTVTELGIDPAQVVAYENQNERRPQVLDALAALSADAEDAEEPLVAA